MADEKRTYMLKAPGHQSTFIWEGEYIGEIEWYWRALTQKLEQIEKLLQGDEIARLRAENEHLRSCLEPMGDEVRQP